MNRKQEQEVIKALVAAGCEPLAKAFAKSRGYGVRANSTNRQVFMAMKELDLGILRLTKMKWKDQDIRLLVKEMDQLSEVVLDHMKALGW